ncbi:universal stress protein [Pontibacter russatus]|uniref:universal stress protein n=1 Tax=Pontibacter russatus TaxID=2694929 RepID=UPI00137B0FA6|nr:universal stress protein [Pontibacter russatus]
METILCPTDFSQSSENAIRYAEELAQRMNSRIELFHSVVEPDPSSTGSPQVAPARDPAYHQVQKNKLDLLKCKLEDAEWGIPIAYHTQVGYGYPGDTIPLQASEVQADLVIIGNEKANGSEETFLKSVAADVIKKAPCPVLLIPPTAAFKPIYKIVFATDLQGEPYSDMSLVFKLAGLFEAEILFLHVLTDEFTGSPDIAKAEYEREHKRFSYKNTSFHTERGTNLEDSLSQFCRRHKANFLVMGYHPQRLWQHPHRQDYSLEMAYHTLLPLLILHYHR